MTRRFSYIAIALAFIASLTSCREYEVTLRERMRPGITIANTSLSIIDETCLLTTFVLHFNSVLETEGDIERYEMYERYFDNYKLERVDDNTYELCSLIYGNGSKEGFRITTDGKTLGEGGSWQITTFDESLQYSISGTTDGYNVEIAECIVQTDLFATATLSFKEYDAAVAESETESKDVLSLCIAGQITASESDALTLNIELCDEVRFVSNMGYIAGTVDIECNNIRYGYTDKVIVTLHEGDLHDIEYNGEYAMIPNSNAYYRGE